jgi:DNA-binding LytR/AlgR family response regulator
MSERATNLLTWLAAAAALVAVRTFWCQLHGTATGAEPASLSVAGEWGLKSAAGWMLAAALLVRFGERLLGSALALRRPWTARATTFVGLVVVTLGSETWLLAGDASLAAWFYERLPAHATFAALLLGGYLLARARRATEPRETPRSFEVMTGTGHTTVAVDDIECLEADRNYVNVHTRERTYLLRRSLASLEKSLRPEEFVRVHRSWIVRRAKVREQRAGNVLVLESGRRVRMSRSRAGLADPS